ncbi:MAG: branched-chain amino acid aminotransferase [Chitinophagaceae bacterium]|jgi:branched-chain amino acid aminotransferase|nr:branched-chain amino acid aminotransferase [Chitinophagaceae bacterium]MBP6046146.1 branched-chain amino acid aminotransferase [Ferruginibacter sp.]NMD29388.1 branched-chain amino acid aminotransferase [Bacteroidota bacterium]MBK7090048.1 branched-chain amino acid aminotransferase [Chitinophagaceae bacterium]MBK8774563.1 branched-chain amino acid aminotransferase [Chitinophagaceae bacterium]
MIAAAGIKITKAQNSKLKDINLENIAFGKYFTDHMLEADYEDGEWKNVEIKPYQPLMLEPSISALHYGQAIFEGIKAYNHPNGNAYIFRPQDNFNRFNISAERMQMPKITEDIFMEGMRQLVSIDKSWIPDREDHSLYIRPFMFSTDEMIGVRPSDTYKFMILLSPTGPYYNTPMRIYVEEHFVRAVPGGVGYAKAAGNYGAAMYATAQAKKKGYDQVLWTDAFEHKYVQECGTMNVFFIIGNSAITPDLSKGTILAGITRESAMQELNEMGFKVEEKELSIDDIIDAHKAGLLYEAFGTGTAATISLIKELRYKDYVMKFDVDQWQTAPKLAKRLNDIRYGLAEDVHGWMYKV